tara:strand:- start:2389 stop:2862 length:474 start_codon:yes stop_codon:yes gene_type:complete
MKLFNIFSILGSLASIIGLVLTFQTDNNKRNKILYGIIAILAVSTSILSYQYKISVDAQLDLENRKVQIRKNASALLESYPSFANQYKPGQNEGMVNGLLILLEENKDLYPDTYNQYRTNVMKKIVRADIINEYEKRDLMEEAGNSALQFLKALAKK